MWVVATACSLVRDLATFKLLMIFGFGFHEHPAVDQGFYPQSNCVTEHRVLICPLEEPYSPVALKAIYLWTVFCSPSSFPNLYRHLYSQHLLLHYLNHLISYFLLVWFPLALLLTPFSSLLPSKALGIWSCAQMFASCESSTVSLVVSGSRCSDVSLPPSLPLRLCFLYKHQIAMMLFFSIQRVPHSWPPTRLCYHILGDGWKTARSICRARLD